MWLKTENYVQSKLKIFKVCEKYFQCRDVVGKKCRRSNTWNTEKGMTITLRQIFWR
jgi:hypothetical protein